MLKEQIEQRNKMLARIKRAEPEFLEYLEELDADNYRAFKSNPNPDMDSVHKGYGQAIECLIKAFEKCDKEEVKVDQAQLEQPWN